MWSLSYLAIAVGLAGGVVQQIPPAPTPHPNDGTVADRLYTNGYFHLSWRPPSGWTRDIAGPAPSRSGYYVLRTFMPAGEPTANVLIAAQDTFFGPKGIRDPKAMADEVGRAMAALAGMTIDRQPAETTISGRPFSRVDFSGVGLFRSTWITEMRCHLVSFNLMANTREQLEVLIRSLDAITGAGDGTVEHRDPTCIDNYPNPENLVAKVDPEAIGPTFVPIPVRIMIGADGSVKNVHVISATAAQRSSIENALTQWKFRPRETTGHADVIETGLIIEFRPGGTVRYISG